MRTKTEVQPIKTINTKQRPVLYFSLICFFYMIAFPKGGIKINDVPLTIGYACTIPLILSCALRLPKSALSLQRISCAALCLLVALWSYLSFTRFGAQSSGYLLAYFVSISYIPIFCLLFFSGLNLDRWNIPFENCLKFAVRFIAVYAVLLFFYKYVTGDWIEIPYLTVNSQDVGLLDEKHINRAGVFKAISTYNNGNIFGVCMIIMMPLYNRIEDKGIFNIIFLTALLLTLSRTVWIGLLLTIIVIAISNGLKIVQVAYVTLISISVCIGLFGIMLILGFDSDFLFDRSLGGRLSQLSYLYDGSFLPNKMGVDLPEIVYFGIIHNYGYAGLLLFCAALFSPIVMIKSFGVKFFSARRASACMQGLCLYAVMALSDAAFNYIPTMMIYWMVASWGIWYASPARKSLLQKMRVA